jgi:hypothetical protein
MDAKPLENALDRAEQALMRIERAVERGALHDSKDEALRSRVAGVLSELDELIREAGA